MNTEKNYICCKKITKAGTNIVEILCMAATTLKAIIEL